MMTMPGGGLPGWVRDAVCIAVLCFSGKFVIPYHPFGGDKSPLVGQGEALFAKEREELEAKKKKKDE